MCIAVIFIAVMFESCSGSNICDAGRAVDVSYSAATKKFPRSTVEKNNSSLVDLGKVWKISFPSGDLGGSPMVWVNQDDCSVREVLSSQ